MTAALDLARQSLSFTFPSFRFAPELAVILPLFVIYRRSGLYDTYPGMILAHQLIALPLVIWIMLSFFNDLPREIEEAARVDGAGIGSTLWHVALPLHDLLDQLDLTRTEQLLDLGPSRLFVTHGVGGSETIAAGERVAVPLVPAERVVDATMAGDAYAAGTLSALIRGLAPPEAARVGAATASFVVEAWGAQGRLPRWGEVASRRDAQPSLRALP